MSDEPVLVTGTGGAQASRPALDELMMAMDVVDTLRHNEQVALNELEQDGRDEKLKERLRRLYESQGLVVTDDIIDEGIRALKEDRFTYKPPHLGFSRTLASIWIKRKFYATIALAFLAVGALSVVYSGYRQYQQAAAATALQTELHETLPAQFKNYAELALREAKVPEATQKINNLVQDGQAALKQQDVPKAKIALTALQAFYGQLVQTYQLRIVLEPNANSAVFRTPDLNTRARNYYLIVDAVDANGKPVTLPITSEENNKTRLVSRWGIRVPAETYEMVRRDKQDDGIIQNRIVGQKPRGALKPSYAMSVMDGAITEW